MPASRHLAETDPGPDPRELELGWICYPGIVRLLSRLGEITLEPRDAGPAHDFEEPWRMEFNSSLGPISLLGERRFFQALVAELPERPVIDQLEEAEAVLLAEFASLDLIEAAEALLETPLLLRRFARAETLSRAHWRLAADALTADGNREALELGLPPAAATALLFRLAAPQISSRRLADLPITPGKARLFIGILDMPEETVRDLAVDDIILIEGCRDNIISGMFVCEDGTSWPANVLGATAEVTGLPGESARLAMPDGFPDLDGLDPPPAADAKRLAFEFGAMTYTPRSLRLMETGASIPVERLEEGLVRIWCGKRMLGRGRVVHAEGGIGVKIEQG